MASVAFTWLIDEMEGGARGEIIQVKSLGLAVYLCIHQG